VSRYREAYEFYYEGRYPEAIQSLEAALALDPESPTLVYNLARVHELLGELEPALTYYREYVDRLPAGDRRERERIERAIARIEGALEREPEAADDLAEPLWPDPPLERPPPRRVRGVADAAFWATGGGGLALLATGAVLGPLALDARRRAETFVLGVDGGPAARAEERDRARRLGIATDVVLAVGAGAVVAACLLYVLRERDAEETDPRAAGGSRRERAVVRFSGLDVLVPPSGPGEGVGLRLLGTFP
jgi:tetratricopeptide (TPR) repeat protein